MNRPNPLSALWLAFAASLAAMLWAADSGQRWVLTVAAAMFALVAAHGAYRVVTGSADEGSAGLSESVLRLRELSRITAAVYAWGGTALISIYRFTPLHWQHGWQYGSAMLLIATGLAAYAKALSRPGSALAAPSSVKRLILLSGLQGVATLMALSWLVFSGKLASPKGDWAANAIFTCGALAIVWLSYVAVRLPRPIQGQPA